MSRALLLSLFLLASNGEAQAASLQGQISFGSNIANSLSGTTTTTSLNIPRFNPATGQLNAVVFSFSGNFSCNASNVAQGGVYIPPSYIKSWTWACDYIGTLYGTGFSFATTSYQSDYERSGTGDTYVKTPSVSRTGIPFSKANNRIAYSASPTSPFVQFVGASGSATIYFASQLSTAIPPFSATPGGFSWTPSSAVTVTGAQIEGSSTQQVTIVYDYTPFPILAVPVSSTLQTNPFSLQFSLPETASSGSLKLTFTSGGTDKVLTIPDQFGTAGFHALTFDPTSLIPDGTYAVKISYRTDNANPDAVSAVASNVRIDTQPLTVWKKAALGDPNASNNGDTDGDGIPNLMEFALGSNPQAFSRTDLPAPGVEVNATDGKHYNTMSYRRRINPGTLVYTLQFSSDLITWAAIPAANLEQIGSPVPVGDGVNEVVSFRVLPAVEDSPGAVSMRLSVTP